MSDDLRDQLDEMLGQFWDELMDDCSAPAMDAVRGAVRAAVYLGGLTPVEFEGWNYRITRCPSSGGHHQGERSWCAYCGNLDVDGYAIK